ncbi:MAG TPA: hypothetical protein PK339_13295 [Flavitalea sp.]|nr:hypothetical protein [Flavitalea sp.]
MPEINRHPASFRDPSGFVFNLEGKIYRQINKPYSAAYDLLMRSGLYDRLTARGMMIPHTEVTGITETDAKAYKIIQPEPVPFISYPYEWCFQQLKDAALLTLMMVKTSMEYGMILKDATPYNIQFHKGKPVFIDTLSFEPYEPSRPWTAYRQFCNMFLFPLYLEFYLRGNIQKILSAYLEGIPADITSRMLPLKSGLNLGVWLHVHLQNKVAQNARTKNGKEEFSQKKLQNLIHHLETIILSFTGKRTRSQWSDYYQETILGKEYLEEKEKIFRTLLEKVPADSVLDLGANDGYFTKIIAEKAKQVIAADNDQECINNLYREIKRSGNGNILPLTIDIANPSPAIGFHNRERAAFHDRIKTGLVVALALIHHLAIGRNIALPVLAAYFADIAPLLIIEWIPQEDEKVRQMLSSREHVFREYTEENFERYFYAYFRQAQKIPIAGTRRILYLMERN